MSTQRWRDRRPASKRRDGSRRRGKRRTREAREVLQADPGRKEADRGRAVEMGTAVDRDRPRASAAGYADLRRLEPKGIRRDADSRGPAEPRRRFSRVDADQRMGTAP